MNFKSKSAFTLAEMMVVMLILSIVTAASLPIITKRSHSTDTVWQWASNGTDAYFGQGATQGAIIGSTSFNSSASSKLLLNTGSLGQNHILFKQGEVETGHLVVDNSGNIGLGKISLGVDPPNSPTITNALAIGTEAFATAERGIALGYDTSAAAPYTIALGSETRADMTNGIAIGCRTGASKEESISIGYNSGANGTGSVVVGAESGTTGDYSTALGYKTYAAGAKGIAIGTGNSSYGAIAEEGIAIGYLAIANGSSPGVAIGSGANSNTGGVAIGAATNSKNGSVAVGPGARAGTTEDTAVGYLALASKDLTSLNTNNTAIGYNALRKSTNSYWNTAIGAEAMANDNYSGHNVAVGYKALYSNTNGGSNIAIGVESLSSNHSGSNNVAIGEGACKNVTGSNKICIGKDSGPSAISYDEKSDSIEHIYIGSASKFNGGNALLEVHNRPSSDGRPVVIINGDMVIRGRTYMNNGDYQGSNTGSVSNPALVRVDSYDAMKQEGVYWTPSDKRLKNVGEDFNSGLDKVRALHVFNYTFKKDKDKTLRVGVIAQDLQKVFPDAVKKGRNGFLMIRQEDMFYAMLNSIKELDKITQGLANELKALFANVQKIDDKITALIRVDQINSQRIKALENKNKTLEAENKQLKNQNKAFDGRLRKLEKLAQK